MNLKLLSIIGSALALVGVGWAIYAGIIRPITKPNPNESQHAGTITNYNYTFEPHQTFFGCARYNAPAPEAKK